MVAINIPIEELRVKNAWIGYVDDTLRIICDLEADIVVSGKINPVIIKTNHIVYEEHRGELILDAVYLDGKSLKRVMEIVEYSKRVSREYFDEVRK